MFQSLFSWMLLSGRHARLTGLDGHLGFQSLFSWMLLSGWPDAGLSGRARDVSILVLVDVAQWLDATAIAWKSAVFQSLFSWMLLSGGRDRCRPSRCWQVSILVLVDVAQWHRRLITVALAERDVSILVLVDVAQWLGADLVDQTAAMRFNPCSRGCCSVARSPRSRPMPREVSILVLVDVAQWPRSTRSRRDADVSILVLVDVAQWPRASTADVAAGEVSILVLVDVAQWPRN